MGFRYESETASAVDDDTGARVERTSAYSDIGGVLVYWYSSGDLSFEFFVSSREENRPIKSRGKPITYPVTVATLIDESALRQAFFSAAPKASEADFARIKEAIAKAVYEIDSSGGDLLRYAPDYQVQFVPQLGEGGHV
jgi:hypothetical protein